MHQSFVTDNKSLPLREDSIDLIISRSVTHYEQSKESNQRVLSEVSRILKNGGYFVNQTVMFHNPEQLNQLRKLHEIVGKKKLKMRREELVILFRITGVFPIQYLCVKNKNNKKI